LTADRRAGFGDELDGTSTVDLAVLVQGPPDPTTRATLLDRVRAAAAEAPDRTAAVERTRRRVGERMLVRLNRVGFVVTWAGIPWAGASPLRVQDRVWLTLAAQDAAVADLLADRLSPADRDQLRAGWEVAASMPGLGFGGMPTIDGPRGMAVAVVLVAVVLVTGLWPVLLLLALQRRRRRLLEDRSFIRSAAGDEPGPDGR
jgi:hypothetical protein